MPCVGLAPRVDESMPNPGVGARRQADPDNHAPLNPMQPTETLTTQLLNRRVPRPDQEMRGTSRPRPDLHTSFPSGIRGPPAMRLVRWTLFLAGGPALPAASARGGGGGNGTGHL